MKKSRVVGGTFKIIKILKGKLYYDIDRVVKILILHDQLIWIMTLYAISRQKIIFTRFIRRSEAPIQKEEMEYIT